MPVFFVQPQTLNPARSAFARLEDHGTAAQKGLVVVTALEKSEENAARPGAKTPTRLNQVPLFFFSAPHQGFPLATEALARAFTDLLNGHEPAHRLKTGGTEIYYRPLHDGGFSLYFRKPDGGISKEGLIVTATRTDSASDLRAAALEKINPAFMKALCDAMEMRGDPAPAKPAPRPR